MSTAIKNGAVGWTDVGGAGGKKGKDSWLRLSPGDNLIRLLTLPYQYHQHRYEPDGGKKYGYRLNCSRSEAEKSCPLCEMGNKAKCRWFVGVIDRKTGTYKTLDIGYSVVKSIQTLAKSQWGSPDRFDVNIVVDPQGGVTGYYYVSPMPPSPLSAADILLQEENSADDLEARTQPPSPQSITERLVKIQEEINATTGGSDSANSSSKNDDEDEEEDFFKNYDGKKKVS